MEDKLAVGMYVRTKDGCIFQILRTTYSKYLSRNKELCYEVDRPINVNMELYDEDIFKASHNIIDLIEVGDVITTNNLCGEVTHIEGDKIYTTCYDGEYCYDYQIQSILTREQFESMKYEVKRNE